MFEKAKSGQPQSHSAASQRSTIPPGSRVKSAVQAANLQRFAYDACMSLKKGMTKEGEMTVTREDAAAIAQLLKSWDTARDAVRILKGKGLPASVRAKSSSSAGPVEPLNPA